MMNNEWQPIETCPKEPYQGYLVYSQNDMFVAYWTEDDYGCEYNFWAIDDRKHGPYCIRGASITHWMPLPEAPK